MGGRRCVKGCGDSVSVPDQLKHSGAFLGGQPNAGRNSRRTLMFDSEEKRKNNSKWNTFFCLLAVPG